MNLLKKFINLIIIALFFILAYLIAKIVFFSLILGIKEVLLTTGIISFFSAFFAFFFFMILDCFKRNKDKYETHYNAVVKIGRLLNRTVSKIETNINVHKSTLKGIQEGFIPYLTIFDIPVGFQLLNDLKNIDFLNEVFDFNAELETLIRDLYLNKEMYDDFKRDIKENLRNANARGILEIYDSNIKYAKTNFSNTFEIFIEKLMLKEEKAIRLCAISKLLGEENKNKTFLFGIHVRKKYPKNFESKILKKVQKEKEEIEQCKKESKKEIGKIMNNVCGHRV